MEIVELLDLCETSEHAGVSLETIVNLLKLVALVKLM